MTTSVRLGAEALSRCHLAAREEGLAPALTVLGSLVVPGLLPCGPGGHAVVPQEVAASADRVWLDGAVVDRSGLDESTVDAVDLPGGAVVLLRTLGTRSGEDGPEMYGNGVLVPRLREAAAETDPAMPDAVTFEATFDRATFDPVAADPVAADQRSAWALGLVWLRLGLSEALRETCMRYLNGRRTGNTTLLQQQMVKSTVADGLIEHLEVRAVLTGVDAGELPAVILSHLHARITAADRWLVNLLGASGYLVGGPGQVAHVSELLAEAYVRPGGESVEGEGRSGGGLAEGAARSGSGSAVAEVRSGGGLAEGGARSGGGLAEGAVRSGGGLAEGQGRADGRPAQGEGWAGGAHAGVTGVAGAVGGES
ncbi:hypothetical protein AB0425_12480 [Actinosynnema sp. NPDC051121]